MAEAEGYKKLDNDAARPKKRRLPLPCIWTFAAILVWAIMECVLVYMWPPAIWLPISTTKGCETASDEFPPLRIDTASGLSGKSACATLCEYTDGCAAIDYFTATNWCNLFAIACQSPTADWDGATSHMIVIPCTLSEGETGVLINGECQTTTASISSTQESIPKIVGSPRSQALSAIILIPYMLLMLKWLFDRLSAGKRKVFCKVFGNAFVEDILILLIGIPLWLYVTNHYFGGVKSTALEVLQMTAKEMAWYVVGLVVFFFTVEGLVKDLLWTVISGAGYTAVETLEKVGEYAVPVEERGVQGAKKRRRGCPAMCIWTLTFILAWAGVQVALYYLWPPTAWVEISASSACEATLDPRPPYKLNGMSVGDLRACKTSCEYTPGCKAVDWFTETEFCNLYAAPCKAPTASHDGASAYMLAHPCTTDKVARGYIKNGKCIPSTSPPPDKQAEILKVMVSPNSIFITSLMAIPYLFLIFRKLAGKVSHETRAKLEKRCWCVLESPCLRDFLLIIFGLPLWAALTFRWYGPPPKSLTEVVGRGSSELLWYAISAVIILMLLESFLKAFLGSAVTHAMNTCCGCLCGGSEEDDDEDEEDKAPAKA